MKFKVGERYEVCITNSREYGNIIEIIEVFEKMVCYKTIKGSLPIMSRFEIGSTFSKCLRPVKEKKEKFKVGENETIVIYRKGNETIALDKRTGKKAVAKCSPEDTFNFGTGAELAFRRLIGISLFEPKKLLNTKIIFTKGDNTFKTGHIYEIKNGKLKCPYGGPDLPKSKEYDGTFYSIEDVRDYFTGTKERKHDSGWSFITLEFIEVIE